MFVIICCNLSLYVARDSSWMEICHRMLSICCGQQENDEDEFLDGNAMWIKWIREKNQLHMQQLLTKITKHHMEIDHFLNQLN